MQLLAMKDTTVLPVGSLQCSPATRNPEDLEPIDQEQSSTSLDHLVGGQEMQCGGEARVVARTNQQNHSVEHIWAPGNQHERLFANLTSGIKRYATISNSCYFILIYSTSKSVESILFAGARER
jgi:hypothetical protein